MSKFSNPSEKRKAPEVKAQQQEGVEPDAKKPVELEQSKFNNVIRLVRNGSIASADQLRNAAFEQLKSLGLHRDEVQPETKTPGGSDQVDVGSVITWMGKVTKADKVAVQQLRKIRATAKARQ